MGLKEYAPATRSIPLSDTNSLTVRGLAFDDMQYILVNHSKLIDTALQMMGETGLSVSDLNEDATRQVAMQMISMIPELAGQIIAIAADEPSMAGMARRLPAPVQVDALFAVFELTFTEPGAVGKFFDRLTNLMSSIQKAGTAANATSMNGLQAGSSNYGSTSLS